MTVAPTGLPVEDCVDEVRTALDGPGVAVLQAPPGAGKTTVVPLRLLDERWLADQRIVVLEPRRLAARAAAGRMAELLGEDVGGTVGYRTRDESVTSAEGRIEVVTEGILVRRLQSDPALDGVGLVVLDEVHERSIHSDLALALLLDARGALRPDLRVLAMSATLDAERLAAVLGGGPPAPVVTSAGRAHPVELRWNPPPDRTPLPAHAARVAAGAVGDHDGDVLVFLPGAADIRRAASALAGALPDHVDVRPLFGALPAADQDRALAPSPPGRRRVVLATDIAESSLTVAGVRIVVDAGRARVPRLDPRTGLTRLETVTASQASAEQRAGRAGRTAPGLALRLWSEASHATRPRAATPEIAQVDLAGLALDLALWGAGPEELAFLDPPPAAALAEARRLLTSLGALDGDGRPTTAGRRIAELPLHPRLARMVVDGAADHRGWEACLLAAALEERDVLRGRAEEVPADAAERLRLLADRSAHHPRADVGAVRGARRRADRIARRARVRPRGDVDLTVCGPLLGLAYPDRLAQSRPGERVRLRNGTGAVLPATDPLAAEAYLAVAEVDTAPGGGRPGPGLGGGAAQGRGGGRSGAGGAIEGGRVRIAAALDEADVVTLGGDEVVTTTAVVWDDGRDDLRARTERRLGALVLAAHDGPADPGPATTAALVAHVAEAGLDALRWPDAARSLQQRVAFARRARPDEGWPDLSDAALRAELDDWLAPRLAGARGRRDLERVDVLDVLRQRLGWPGRSRLDEVAPATLEVGGREVPIDWSGDQPAAHLRVQDLYGTTSHPTVDRGRVPVVLHLQSPAGRDVQVTADLPGFWAGSWAEVRREMAGRYPKHPWPTDPASASPPPRRARPRRR